MSERTNSAAAANSGATRERFETIARNKNRGVLSGFSDGAYHDPEDQSNWQCWQAATADMDELLGVLRAIVADAKDRNEPGQTWDLVAGGLIDDGEAVLARYGKS